MPASSVEWQTYAKSYDMLLSYNPFYQELRQQVMQEIRAWNLSEASTLLDMGAGTGNYSSAIAKEYPHLSVIHVDRDAGMIERAREKKMVYELDNLLILQQSVEETNFQPNSLTAIAAIHSLYTFPNPASVIQKFYEWMEPGGYGIFVDPGRKLNVLDWQWAIGQHLIKTYGIKRTWQILRDGKEVSKQNRKLQRMQARGEFWLHSHEEFCATIQSAGFEILRSEISFRGVSDLVVVRKK